MFISLVAVSTLFCQSAWAARIKDLTNIKGVRNNQLVGYGLVVGLDGTGDGKKAAFTVQSMVAMLEKMGITVSVNDIKVNNVAAVMVTAVLPPFARAGSTLDVLVSSIGDAKNLQGGTLLLTPLKAANGQVYAVAQGPVVTGGFSSGGAGANVQKNFPTAGRLVDGAIIERDVSSDFNARTSLVLSLERPDFTTATRVSDAINALFYEQIASAMDAGSVQLKVPAAYAGNVVELVAMIEKLDVKPDNTARVVINERTGTIVMGEDVRLSTIAIAHGNLSIVLKENTQVSQPSPFSQGQTTATPDTQVDVKEDEGKLILMQQGTSIRDVIDALNALGVSPRDLIAILQAIKAAGAIQADLEVI